jgi:hypothetical protein
MQPVETCRLTLGRAPHDRGGDGVVPLAEYGRLDGDVLADRGSGRELPERDHRVKCVQSKSSRHPPTVTSGGAFLALPPFRL